MRRSVPTAAASQRSPRRFGPRVVSLAFVWTVAACTSGSPTGSEPASLPERPPAPAESSALGPSSRLPPPRRLSHGFPIPHDAAEFCSGGVHSPDGMEIRWTTHWVPRTYDVVVDHYRRLLGSEQGDPNLGGIVWRFPSAEHPERTLSVYGANSQGPWRECDVPPNAAAVIMTSSTPRPDGPSSTS